MYEGLIVESGKLKDWKLVTLEEYAKRYGRPIQLGEGGAILLVQTQKTHFALVLQRTRSGDYRAKQLVR